MRLNSIIFNIITILVFHIGFITLSYVHFNSYSKILYLFNIVVAVFIFTKSKLFFCKKYFKINMLVILYCILTLVSSLYSRNIETIVKGIFYGISIINLFIYFEYVDYSKQFKKSINIFYYICLIYIIINDLLMFIKPNVFSLGDSYLVGNKFMVCYLHLFTLAFYYQKNINKINIGKRHILIPYVILLFYISIVTKCSTTVTAAIIFMILILIPNKIKEKLYNSNFVITITIIVSSWYIFFTSILSNRFVQYFIVNILNEDLTLTGRDIIYQNIIKVINKSPYWGYGHGNTYQIVKSMINAPNAQNGFLDSVVTYGIWATLVLIIIIYSVFFNVKNNSKKMNIYPVVVVIFIFIILSSIEITLRIQFIALLSILNIFTKVKRVKCQ